LLGNVIGLFFAYKAYKLSKDADFVRYRLGERQGVINTLSNRFDKQLLFIHHSVGRIWLGPGELRSALMANGIGVKDATRGDEIGESTDMSDWIPKFTEQFDKVLKFEGNPNVYYKDARQNDIIMFKSCFPNSNIIAEGEAPGNANDKTMTVWNFKAIMNELKGVFQRHPQKTFIYVTSPPLAQFETNADNAKRARQFADWVKTEYLRDYGAQTGLKNLLIFDFYDILADSDNMLKKEYMSRENDSHPNVAGCKIATDAFISFLAANGVIQGK